MASDAVIFKLAVILHQIHGQTKWDKLHSLEREQWLYEARQVLDMLAEDGVLVTYIDDTNHLGVLANALLKFDIKLGRESKQK